MNFNIKPRNFASQHEYRDRLFEKFANREDNRPNFHVGDKAIPTIGPGIELIVQIKVRNKPIRFAPRKRKQIDDYLSAAYGQIFKLSDAGWRRFNNAADKLNLLNKKGISDAVRKQAVKAAMTGHGIRDLPPGGGRLMFNAAVKEAEEGINNDIRQAARDADINPDAAVPGFANSRERQALVSLRYNNIQSPKALAAPLQGNRAEANLEIAYRSNGSKEAGFVARRMAEARDVLGDPKTWTPDQKRQWNEVYLRNRVEIEKYEKMFGDRILPKGYFSHHVKQAGHPLPAGADLKRISVQSGDTLGKIAKDHNLDPDALEKANPKITDPDKLRAGQTIVIPSAKATPNAAPAGSNPSQKSAPNATQTGKPQQGGSLSDDAPAEREVAEAETETGTEAGTEKELDSMIGHDANWLDGGRHPLGDPLQKMTKDFFDNLYPEPQGGRTFTPPAEPRPLAISHEVPLSHGRKVVADDLSNKAANSNIPDAVRGLQTTLNKRGYGNPQHILPHLKEDGDFGPRTLARLDEELLRGGPSSVIRDLNGMAVA